MDGLGFHGASQDRSGEGLWATSLRWTWLIPTNESSTLGFGGSEEHLLCEAACAEDLCTRLCASRLGAIRHVPERRSQKRKTHSVVSVSGKAGRRKGRSSWVLRDEEELAGAKPLTKGQKVFLSFVTVSQHLRQSLARSGCSINIC